jgi:hypothetical protein
VVVMVEIFVAAMEAVETQGSAVVAWMDVYSLLPPHSFI